MASRNRGHGSGDVYKRPNGRLVAHIMIEERRYQHYVKTK